MLKDFLRAKNRSLEQKKKKFGNKTAKLILLFIMLWAVFLIAQPVMAATIEPGLNIIGTPLGLGTEDIRITIAKIIRVALGFLGVIAVVIIMYGGFLYLTSYGAEDKIKKAKEVLRDAVIGLIIILLSYAIASFVISRLLEATGGGGGAPPDYGDYGGALGNGIIESHYPARNAVGVARNTSIVVTFKVPMNANTIIYDINNTPEDLTDDVINTDNIKIHITGQTDNITNVRATRTEDARTYVFKPIDYLGNSEQPTNYTVELLGTIEKADGKGAFGAYGSYKWSFEVSTVIDITPPQITSVIPKPDQTVPRNMVVQVNFNEAINPLTISGTTETNQIIIISAAGTPIAGKFSYGNMYQTVEFVTNDLCGKNTCGGDVFCLPGNKNISALVKAATLDGAGPSAIFPFDGIVDLADNSLDGNSNGIAQGPAAKRVPDWAPYNLNEPNINYGDDVIWSFSTNNTIDLEPPELNTGYFPEANNQNVNPASILGIPFTKLMMKTTLKPDRGYGDGYCACADNGQCPGTTCDTNKHYCLNEAQERFVCTHSIPIEVCAGGQECQESHHLTLVQPETANYIPRGYYLTSEEITTGLTEATKAYLIPARQLAEYTDYGLLVGSGVKDLMQNCFQPCAGPGCVKHPAGIPGQYEQGSPWQPETNGFPSCQITTPL